MVLRALKGSTPGGSRQGMGGEHILHLRAPPPPSQYQDHPHPPQDVLPRPSQDVRLSVVTSTRNTGLPWCPGPSVDVGDPPGDHAAKSVKCATRAAPVDARFWLLPGCATSVFLFALLLSCLFIFFFYLFLSSPVLFLLSFSIPLFSPLFRSFFLPLFSLPFSLFCSSLFSLLSSSFSLLPFLFSLFSPSLPLSCFLFNFFSLLTSSLFFLALSPG